MKVLKSAPISSFGGINFVFDQLKVLDLEACLTSHLPNVGKMSSYGWSDVFNSLLSVYFCGGDCIEDLQTHLRPHFEANPFVKLPSSDTVLRRLSQLSNPEESTRTKRGTVDHRYSVNDDLLSLNIAVLKKLNQLEDDSLTMDYDNTIIFNEKKDSQMTYKKNPGYQPGVCMVNSNYVLALENRGGNSDAKSFQNQTLRRVFDQMEKQGVPKIENFRADAASYQFDVVKLVEKHTRNFYIGCRNSYVEKYFSQVEEWDRLNIDEAMEVGEIMITPFKKEYKKGATPVSYRLIVKRSPCLSKQIDLITQDAYQYRAILTNNQTLTAREVALFYNQRGMMEKQFGILKNDFGWQKLPFSALNKNTVFLYFTAIISNLYNYLVTIFSEKVKGLKPTHRIKRFIFTIIMIPAKWVKQGGQYKLRVYSEVGFKT